MVRCAKTVCSLSVKIARFSRKTDRYLDRTVIFFVSNENVRRCDRSKLVFRLGFSVDVILDTFLRSIRWVLLQFFCQTKMPFTYLRQNLGVFHLSCGHSRITNCSQYWFDFDIFARDLMSTWGWGLDKGVRTGRGLIINIKPY